MTLNDFGRMVRERNQRLADKVDPIMTAAEKADGAGAFPDGRIRRAPPPRTHRFRGPSGSPPTYPVRPDRRRSPSPPGRAPRPRPTDYPYGSGPPASRSS